MDCNLGWLYGKIIQKTVGFSLAFVIVFALKGVACAGDVGVEEASPPRSVASPAKQQGSATQSSSLQIGDGDEKPSFDPTPLTSASDGNGTASLPTDPDARAVYDRTVLIMADRSLSYSDRRNRLRIVRQSFGDDLFLSVIRDVPVHDVPTERIISFADYMADLAGTYVGHPLAPISFDPVGAAMQIYFSPTEETVRRMTGIGVSDERVEQFRSLYLGELAEQQSDIKSSASRSFDSPPPVFISRDPELKASYDRARMILSSSTETEETRAEKLRIMQDEVGQERMTLLLRYVPVIDLESGSVRSFDTYIKDLSTAYGASSGSPIERDPIGAGMRIFFDPSPQTISAMTGMGLPSDSRRDASDHYNREREELNNAVNQIVSDTVSSFGWEDVKKNTSAIASIFGSD